MTRADHTPRTLERARPGTSPLYDHLARTSLENGGMEGKERGSVRESVSIGKDRSS